MTQEVTQQTPDTRPDVGEIKVRHIFEISTARAAEAMGVMFPAYCGKWISPTRGIRRPLPADQVPDRCPLCALVCEDKRRRGDVRPRP